MLKQLLFSTAFLLTTVSLVCGQVFEGYYEETQYGDFVVAAETTHMSAEDQFALIDFYDAEGQHQEYMGLLYADGTAIAGSLNLDYIVADNVFVMISTMTEVSFGNLCARDQLPGSGGTWHTEEDPNSETTNKTDVREEGSGWWHPDNPTNDPKIVPVQYKEGTRPKPGGGTKPTFRPCFPEVTFTDDDGDGTWGDIEIHVCIDFKQSKDGDVYPLPSTDNRSRHFNDANCMVKEMIDDEDWTQPMDTTWHHLNYNPDTCEGEMVLVLTATHSRCHHTGSYSDYRKHLLQTSQ